jgi:hypothetical protein
MACFEAGVCPLSLATFFTHHIVRPAASFRSSPYKHVCAEPRGQATSRSLARLVFRRSEGEGLPTVKIVERTLFVSF